MDPLHHAAAADDPLTIYDRLDNGVDPDVRDDQGRTPWMIATCFGREYLVKMAHTFGARLNAACDNHANTIAHYAAHLGYRRILSYALVVGAHVDQPNLHGTTVKQLMDAHDPGPERTPLPPIPPALTTPIT